MDCKDVRVVPVIEVVQDTDGGGLDHPPTTLSSGEWREVGGYCIYEVVERGFADRLDVRHV